jgi:hypothetical protein
MPTTTIADRIVRRLDPYLEKARTDQQPRNQALIADAASHGRHGLRYSTEPARDDQPGRWCCWIAYDVIDQVGDWRTVATIAGTVVGIVVTGEFRDLTYTYLPDQLLDDDLGLAPIEFDPAELPVDL